MKIIVTKIIKELDQYLPHILAIDYTKYSLSNRIKYSGMTLEDPCCKGHNRQQQ